MTDIIHQRFNTLRSSGVSYWLMLLVLALLVMLGYGASHTMDTEGALDYRHEQSGGLGATTRFRYFSDSVRFRCLKYRFLKFGIRA